jgi:hypothetical protein
MSAFDPERTFLLTSAKLLQEVVGDNLTRRRSLKMKHLMTLLLFVGAVFAYIAGSMPGVTILLAVGMMLESIAWYRVFHSRKHLVASKR